MGSSIKYSKAFALEFICANFQPDSRHITDMQISFFSFFTGTAN